MQYCVAQPHCLTRPCPQPREPEEYAKYGKKIDPKQKDKVMEKVKETFQLCSDARSNEEPPRFRF